MEKIKMQTKFNSKTTVIAMLALLMISMLPFAFAQVPVPADSHVPSYPYLNVAPNPAGVGQTVTLNMFLAVPQLSSEPATNFTIIETTPHGETKTLGPFKSDATGGTYTTIVPDTTGNYTFQFFYGGQTLTGVAEQGASSRSQYAGVIVDPSHTDVKTLVVQEEAIPSSSYPITPLPNNYWETPITAENVQNWYAIGGPWLGYGSVTFASTGGYNATGNYNPYTQSVMSGHVLWTKVWASGGATGGDLGGTESSNYWSTSQYWPKYAPVIMNGIMYSTHYTETTGYSAGIDAVNLYTGETLWTINTTSILRGGMNVQWKTLNAYGAIGPYIWTTGNLPASDTGGTAYNTIPRSTQFNMYSALTGQYVESVVNGTNPTFTTDENGNMIGYYINSTVGTMNTWGPVEVDGTQHSRGAVAITATQPVLCCFNMSQAISIINPTTQARSNSWGWAPALNTAIDFGRGVMWAVPVFNNISDAIISPALAINGITDNAVVLTGGFTVGQGSGGETNGWLVVGAQDATTGAQLWCKNFTSQDTSTLLPFTRTQMQIQDGYWINANMYNWDIVAINARSGTQAWTANLAGDNGAEPNHYDIFNLKTWNGPGIIYFEGFGGDIWAFDSSNGHQLWYTNTTKLFGDPGTETPYGIWPLWVFNCACASNDVSYWAVGHEYNPPLFHGAQLFGLNNTDGSLVWSTLDMSVTSTSIAYGVMLSLNAYDNQLYAFGRGPSAMTVDAPSVGVSTATPIVISGTITDVSAGASQSVVAKNFPNGLPCVSDESQSHFMEAVYQQQPMPYDTTGVPVTINVVDSNGNYREIGQTTSVDGTFAYTWTPDIPGSYEVVASFAGSNSYYPSSAIGALLCQ